MGHKQENLGFTCRRCGAVVLPVTNGSYRNHCPFCLHSLHVDVLPGDRQNLCQGLMAPVGVRIHSRKGYQLVHHCLSCGAEQVTRAAVDTVQPDDLDLILALPLLP